MGKTPIEVLREQNKLLWETVMSLADTVASLTGGELGSEKKNNLLELKLLPGGKKFEEQPPFAN